MKYNLTENQRYDTSTLQAELGTATIIAGVNGHGEKSFDVITDDEAGADVVVQTHLAKSDTQHDADIDELDKTNRIAVGLEGSNRDIVKAALLTILDEINILRAQHSLPARTVQQFKSAVKNKL